MESNDALECIKSKFSNLYKSPENVERNSFEIHTTPRNQISII